MSTNAKYIKKLFPIGIKIICDKFCVTELGSQNINISNLISRKQIMENPLLEISDGKIQGTVLKNIDNDNIYGFLGIPFAKPPVGNLRFKVGRNYIKNYQVAFILHATTLVR